MPSCSSRQLDQALVDQRRWHLPVEPRGVGALLRRVGEEAGPVEPDLAQEVEQPVVVVLGLARVADDERGTKGGRRARVPRMSAIAAGEALAVAPPAHPPQQWPGHVLQGEVEVRHAGVADGVDEAVAQLRRVEVQQAGPLDQLGDPTDQPDDGARPAEVPAVRGEVLGDEDDLLRPQGRDLVEHVALGAGPLAPAEGRDGAEPARPIAAFGHLHVRPRRSGRRPAQVEQIEAGHGRRADSVTGTPKPGHAVHLGQGRGQLVAVALGQATRHDQRGPGRRASDRASTVSIDSAGRPR